MGPQGPKGERGRDGANGQDGLNGVNGLSAYEIALKNGFVGTEKQWIQYLAQNKSLIDSIADTYVTKKEKEALATEVTTMKEALATEVTTMALTVTGETSVPTANEGNSIQGHRKHGICCEVHCIASQRCTRPAQHFERAGQGSGQRLQLCGHHDGRAGKEAE